MFHLIFNEPSSEYVQIYRYEVSYLSNNLYTTVIYINLFQVRTQDVQKIQINS